jgi:UDP-2,3-diacylglucosamine hydrolase
LGITVHFKPIELTIDKTSFFIGHGDGLGPGDKGYKRMKKVFTNSFAKTLYRWIHPDLGMRLGKQLSLKNKLISGKEDIKFLGDEKERLAIYCRRKLKEKHFDYFIFGHRHLPLEIELEKNSKYINLGDWITYFTYGVFDGNSVELKTWKNN